MTSKRKQSLIVGALAGSFGIFLSKALGLFYVVPLNQLAGESNMAFYSIAYTYYDLLLKICGAGIPFAIASLVAKYYSRDDYKTVLLVRKIGTSFLLVSSLVVGFLFLILAKPLATSTLGAESSAADVKALYDIFRILVVAVIFVPILSSIRGYYQGLKRMDIYASSQVLEQLIRVSAIVGLGYLAVRIFKLDSVWAIYMAMAAASIAAIVTILYFLLMTKADNQEIQALVKRQEKEGHDAKEILKELLSLGIPYVLISFLGTSSSIVNSNFFIQYATSIGIEYDTAKLVLGIFQVNCNKIAAIPQVLSLGFSAGLVPYLTESYERQDYKKLRSQLSDIFNSVLYFLIPVLMVFITFATPIYYIMFGNANLELGSSIFLTSNILTFTDTIAPIISSILITLRQRKTAITILLLSFITKFISFFPMVKYLGYNGIIYSSALCSFVVIVIGFYIFSRYYHFNLRITMRKAIMIVVAAVFSIIPSIIIMHFFPFEYTSRVGCFLMMVPHGIIVMAIYLASTFYFSLPQTIFHIEGSLKELLKKLR